MRLTSVRLDAKLRHPTPPRSFQSYTPGQMKPEKLPPHLVRRAKKKKACSECGQEFSINAKPSLSRAFSEQVRTPHAANPPVAEKQSSRHLCKDRLSRQNAESRPRKPVTRNLFLCFLEIGGGGRTRTDDLGIMRPSL